MLLNEMNTQFSDYLASPFLVILGQHNWAVTLARNREFEPVLVILEPLLTVLPKTAGRPSALQAANSLERAANLCQDTSAWEIEIRSNLTVACGIASGCGRREC